MRLRMPHSEGMTAADIVRAEGFTGEEAATILVVVNGTQALDDTPIADGDVIELVVPMVGG